MPVFYVILAPKIIKIPDFYDICPKMYKIPEFYLISARKMSEFYRIITRKIFFTNFRGHVPPTPHLLRLWWHLVRSYLNSPLM